MKRFLLAAVAMIFIGCQPAMIWNFKEMDPDISSKNEATVGDVVFLWEYGTKQGNSSAEAVKVDGYHMELVYSGASQNILFLMYREYSIMPPYPYTSKTSGMYLKAGYNHEFRYDLSTSKIITFRDIKIEILSADNEKLSYILLQAPKGYKSKSTARAIGAPKKLSLTLKDGSTITGDVISQEKGKYIEIQKADGKTVTVKWDDITNFKYIEPFFP